VILENLIGGVELKINELVMQINKTTDDLNKLIHMATTEFDCVVVCDVINLTETDFKSMPYVDVTVMKVIEE